MRFTHGKWLASTNEERFDCSEEFDTEAEARDYALNWLADESGLEPGDRVFTGQIEEITPADMAENVFHVDDILERLDEYLYERVGDEVSNELRVMTPAAEDLETLLRTTFVEWCAKHGVKAPSCAIGAVHSYIVERDFDAEEAAKDEAAKMEREASEVAE